MSKQFGQRLNFDDGLRTVQINDAGDVAAININDSTFASKFVNLINWLETAAEEIEKASPKEGERDYTELAKFLEKRVEICTEACTMIDGLFGVGVSKNAFGVDAPDENCILDFLQQIMPFVNWALQERGDNIEVKYDRKRKGARTAKAEIVDAE